MANSAYSVSKSEKNPPTVYMYKIYPTVELNMFVFCTKKPDHDSPIVKLFSTPVHFNNRIFKDLLTKHFSLHDPLWKVTFYEKITYTISEVRLSVLGRKSTPKVASKNDLGPCSSKVLSVRPGAYSKKLFGTMCLQRISY